MIYLNFTIIIKIHFYQLLKDILSQKFIAQPRRNLPATIFYLVIIILLCNNNNCVCHSILTILQMNLKAWKYNNELW